MSPCTDPTHAPRHRPHGIKLHPLLLALVISAATAGSLTTAEPAPFDPLTEQEKADATATALHALGSSHPGKAFEVTGIALRDAKDAIGKNAYRQADVWLADEDKQMIWSVVDLRSGVRHTSAAPVAFDAPISPDERERVHEVLAPHTPILRLHNGPGTPCPDTRCILAWSATGLVLVDAQAGQVVA